MGLSCTLLGHDWGDPETARDRTEQGEEVVITEREFRTCDRCGDQELLSENTEIRPLEPDEAEAATEDEQVTDRYHPPDDIETEDGVILEASGERERGEWPGEQRDSETGSEPPADMEPSDDQTEILTDAEPTDEANGDASPTDENEQPRSESDEDGLTEILNDEDDAGTDPQWDVDPEDLESDEDLPDADPTADQTEVLDADPADAGQGDGTATPESRDETDESSDRDTEAREDGVALLDAGPEARANDADSPIEAPSGTWPDEEDEVTPTQSRQADDPRLVCDFCGHRVAVGESSLRAGDSCPECGRAYLSEEE